MKRIYLSAIQHHLSHYRQMVFIKVKNSANQHVGPHLKYFHQQLQVPHAVQAVYDLPYQEVDCFALKQPLMVPMRTLLSQLV
jgi:uncharacterized protein